MTGSFQGTQMPEGIHAKALAQVVVARVIKVGTLKGSQLCHFDFDTRTTPGSSSSIALGAVHIVVDGSGNAIFLLETLL